MKQQDKDDNARAPMVPKAAAMPAAMPADEDGQAGRICCIAYIIVLLAMLLPHAGLNVIALALGFLFWGGLPALYLMRRTPRDDERGGLYHGIACAALFVVFPGCLMWFAGEAGQDAQGGLVLLIATPLANGLWLLLALPHILHRMRSRP